MVWLQPGNYQCHSKHGEGGNDFFPCAGKTLSYEASDVWGWISCSNSRKYFMPDVTAIKEDFSHYSDRVSFLIVLVYVCVLSFCP